MTVAAAFLICLQTAVVSAASSASIVRDINGSGSSNPGWLTAVGNTLFFTANDGLHGTELWKTDGTSAGTKMVKNIRPYGYSSDPQDLVNVNGTLFFTAVDGKHGRELWKSDGTAAGTVLVKDINTHAPNSYCGNGIYMPYSPVAVGSRLYFFLHCGGVWSPVLWVSDGTAQGTHYINAPYAANHDWEDDRVADTLNGRFYFVVGGDTGPEQIWSSRGTDGTTHLMAGSPSADHITFLPIHGQNLYFVTYTGGDPVTGVRLWKTDGTAAGTRPLTTAGALANVPVEAAYMAKRLYFADGQGGALWKTDGTATGTKKILNRAADSLATAGGKLYFNAYVYNTGNYLWVSNGSAAGTNPFMSFGDVAPSHTTAVGNKVCFNVQDWDAQTWQLWTSDGTLSGTHAVRGFVNPGGTDNAGVSVGNRFYFAADDGSRGVELWSYTP